MRAGQPPAAPNPGLPLDDGLAIALEDAGLPFRKPFDGKGLPVKLFLELTGLMLSRLLLEIDLPLLKEPVLSRPAYMSHGTVRVQIIWNVKSYTSVT